MVLEVKGLLLGDSAHNSSVLPVGRWTLPVGRWTLCLHVPADDGKVTVYQSCLDNH